MDGMEAWIDGTKPGWINSKPWVAGMDAWLEKIEALDGWNGSLDGYNESWMDKHEAPDAWNGSLDGWKERSVDG